MIQTDQIPSVPMPEIPADSVPSGAQVFGALKGLSFEDAISKIANGLVSFGFKLMIAILVFYVGKFIISKIYRMVFTVMSNRRLDASLTTFVLSLVKMVLYFILIITVIGILGIETGSFLALFASAGVAIGMALSGTLQNFAGGVLILLLKPYRVGDYIEAQGYSGQVKAIQIFHTIINTVDNKAIIIPNGGLSTSSINNYSLESYRRVDWKVSLAYGTDYEKASAAIMDILRSDNRVVQTTIDDDIRKRNMHNQEEAEKQEHERIQQLEEECGDDPDCLERKLRKVEKSEKVSWWKRWLGRHKRKIEAEHMNMERSVSGGIKTDENRPPFVALAELADSSIDFTVRVWTHSSNYWPLFFDMNRRFYTELPQKGFSFPFPQMDVHLDGAVDAAAQR